MQTKTRFLVDKMVTPVLNVCSDTSQTLKVEWYGADEIPPSTIPLYVCYNQIEQEDVLHVKTMVAHVLENCRYSDINGWERLISEEYDHWISIPQPDYWAIKEFPRPPISVK